MAKLYLFYLYLFWAKNIIFEVLNKINTNFLVSLFVELITVLNVNPGMIQWNL